jgi:hypothetical protein
MGLCFEVEILHLSVDKSFPAANDIDEPYYFRTNELPN